MEERQDLISRQAAIDIDGLDEQIRCEMCRNPMHTDRGCDGNCKYDEKLYERIMQILDERIKPLSSVQPKSSTDIQDVLGYLDDVLHPLVSPDNWNVYSELHDMISRLPSAQPDLIAKIQNGINVTNADDSYSCGMRNGMRWCISLIDDKEPLYENCPSAQPEITEDDVKEYCRKRCLIVVTSDFYDEMTRRWASAQPESTRTFVELVVEYPNPELCTYKEYRGKPYYSIKYIENGETYIGYGTYNPEVLSQYLKEYFISSVQPDPNALEQQYMKGWEDGRKNLLEYISRLLSLPSEQPDWNELMVICDNCGHAIHVKKENR